MTIHLKGKVEAGGKLVVDGVPLPEGQEVEVSINSIEAESKKKFPLRGTLLQFDDPFTPAVPPEDWDALR